MNNTIPNVPRELLAELQEHIDCHRDAVLWGKVCDLLSAPSPTGVDGLEVRAYERKWSSDNIKPEKRINENGRKEWPFKFKLIPVTQKPCLPDDEPLCRISDAQAIIDGLRGEVDQLQSMLATVSKAGIRVRTDRDQQAQRIGELERLLRDCYPGCGLTARQTQSIRERIDAALSAGKEGE